MDKWISVRDKLPRNGQRVKIRMVGGTEYSDVYYHADWKNPWYKYKIGSQPTVNVKEWKEDKSDG